MTPINNSPDQTTAPPPVGMVLKGYPRISETFISNEIRLLETEGIPIHIFSMRKPRESFTHKSVKAIRATVDYLPTTLLQNLLYSLVPNFRLFRKHPRRYANTFWFAFRRFLDNGKPATFKHLLQAGYLADRLRLRRGVRHLHAHFAHSPTSVARLAAMLSALPYSFTAHAKDIYTAKPEQLREKIEKAAFVVTCTEYNRQYLQHVAGGASTPVYRVYHGIDVRFFQNQIETPAEAFNPSPPYRILTVARLVEKKGIPTVLEALKNMKTRGVALTYTLIGDGDDREALEKQAADLDLLKETTFTGTKPHDYVLDAYRNSDLFVLGCRVAENGDRDGIPNVLMESMAMGVPVIATDVSAIPELVENGKTGLLVPPRDPAALAGAMKRLLTDGTLRKTVIESGRKRVVAEFDNRVMTRDLAGIFQRGIAP